MSCSSHDTRRVARNVKSLLTIIWSFDRHDCICIGFHDTITRLYRVAAIDRNQVECMCVECKVLWGKTHKKQIQKIEQSDSHHFSLPPVVHRKGVHFVSPLIQWQGYNNLDLSKLQIQGSCCWCYGMLSSIAVNAMRPAYMTLSLHWWQNCIVVIVLLTNFALGC